MDDIIKLLRVLDAPRVWTTRMLMRSLDMPPASAARRIAKASELGLLSRVTNGLFLNTMARPDVKLAEAIPFIRSGAIVSLQTVLGDAGVLNNFTPDVTAILPSDGMNTAGGRVETAAGLFTFRRMSSEMLYAGLIADRLVPGLTYPRATPEKSLLDWIVLAKSSHSTMTSVPAHDIDMSEINRDRLMRIARASGLESDVLQLEEKINAAEHSRDFGMEI